MALNSHHQHYPQTLSPYRIAHKLKGLRQTTQTEPKKLPDQTILSPRTGGQDVLYILDKSRALFKSLEWL